MFTRPVFKTTSKRTPNQVGLAALAVNLQAYYPFEDGSGSVVTDESPNSNDGAATGGLSWGAGRIGSYAGYYDGIDDKVVAPATTMLAGASAFSLSVWLYRDVTSDEIWVEMSPPSTPAARRFYLYTFLGNVRCSLYGQSADNEMYFNGNQIPTGGWHNLIWTWESGSPQQAFVDGVEVTYTAQPSFTDVLKTVASPVGIGCKCDGSAGLEFTGRMDDLRIYDRKLTAEDIAFISSQ